MYNKEWVDQTIGICNYYQKKVDQERALDDKSFNGSDAAIESLKQRASCWAALLTYLGERGYDGAEIRKVFESAGEKTTSGFRNAIMFLESKFRDRSEIRALETDLALSKVATKQAQDLLKSCETALDERDAAAKPFKIQESNLKFALAHSFYTWCADEGYILDPFPNKHTDIRMYTKINTEVGQKSESFTPKQVFELFEKSTKP